MNESKAWWALFSDLYGPRDRPQERSWFDGVPFGTDPDILQFMKASEKEFVVHQNKRGR